MTCSENGIYVLATMLILAPKTKPIFRREKQFDKSNSYIEFGRNWVIHDQVRVSTFAN